MKKKHVVMICLALLATILSLLIIEKLQAHAAGVAGFGRAAAEAVVIQSATKGTDVANVGKYTGSYNGNVAIHRLVNENGWMVYGVNEKNIYWGMPRSTGYYLRSNGWREWSAPFTKCSYCGSNPVYVSRYVFFVSWRTVPTCTASGMYECDCGLNTGNGGVGVYALGHWYTGDIWALNGYRYQDCKYCTAYTNRGGVQYKINLDANGGNAVSPLTCTYGTNSYLPSATREGYTIISWNTEADGSGTSYEVGAAILNWTQVHGTEYTLYAQWKQNQYTIQYSGNDTELNIYDDINTTTATGSTPSNTVIYNTNVKLSMNGFKRQGYEFIGWNTEPDNSGTLYSEGQTLVKPNFVPGTPDNNVFTLYAIWEPITYTIEYDRGLTDGTEELPPDLNKRYDQEGKLPEL